MKFETIATCEFMPMTVTSQESPIHEKVWVKDLRARIEIQSGGPDVFVPQLQRYHRPWLRCVILTDYEVMDKSGLWNAILNPETNRSFDISNPVVKLFGCKYNPRYMEESIIQYGDLNFPYASLTFLLSVDYYQYDENALRKLVEESPVFSKHVISERTKNEPATGKYIDY